MVQKTPTFQILIDMTKPRDKNVILKMIPLPRNVAIALTHEAVDKESNFTHYVQDILITKAKQSQYYKEQ